MLLLLGTACLIMTARAEPPLPPRLSLSEAFHIALASNKDIQLAALAVDRAEATAYGARGEFDSVFYLDAAGGGSQEPTPTIPIGRASTEDAALTTGLRKRMITGTEAELSATVDYTSDDDLIDALDPRTGSRLSLILRQDLLKDFGTGVNRTEILILQNETRGSRETLREQVIQNLFEVEQAYWELYFFLADLVVRDEQLQRAKRLVKIAEVRVDVGDAPPIEITRAQSSAAIQTVAMVDARERITKLRHLLLHRMGVMDEEHIATAFDLADTPSMETVPVSLSETMEIARTMRPDLARAHWQVESASLRERHARNQRLPQLQLYGELGLLGLDNEFGSDTSLPIHDDLHAWQVGLVMEFPLANRAARAAYRAARVERREADLRATALLETATRAAADAIEDLRAASASMRSAGEARALAERLLDAEEKSFNLGRTDSVNVLNAQAGLAAAERDEVRARANHAIAIANLHRVRGDLPAARNIAFASAGAEETPSEETVDGQE